MGQVCVPFPLQQVCARFPVGQVCVLFPVGQVCARFPVEQVCPVYYATSAPCYLRDEWHVCVCAGRRASD